VGLMPQCALTERRDGGGRTIEGVTTTSTSTQRERGSSQ
jgi:hypothetical protein